MLRQYTLACLLLLQVACQARAAQSPAYVHLQATHSVLWFKSVTYVQAGRDAGVWQYDLGMEPLLSSPHC
jgi:hypothetical protein